MNDSTDPFPAVVYEIRPKSSFSIGIKSLWQYRELFWHFTVRDVHVKYRHVLLGILWAVIQPICLMVVFTLVFNRGFGLSASHSPYPIFMFSGLVIWQFFANGVTNASNSMLRNAAIIHKIYFPRMVLPLASILGCVLDYCFAFVVLAILVFYAVPGISVAGFLGYSAIGLALAFLAATGAGILLSALNVKYRDFQYILPFLIQLLFFVSPVLYETGQFKSGIFHSLLKFNPLAGALSLQRAAVSGTSPDWGLVGTSSLSLLLLLLTGLVVFRKMEAYFADLS